LGANEGGALVDRSTLENSTAFIQHGDDKNYNNTGGLFDFKISGLAFAGSSVAVVIPQLVAIPDGAVYRKLHFTNGWQEFVSDNNNKLFSAVGSLGVCPQAFDSSYSEGLTPGDWCVMLLIEDGGPNDADATANKNILDPGGVSQAIAISTVSIPTIGSISEGGTITLTANIINNGNTIVSYLWEQTDGPSVDITNSSTLNASVSNAPVGVLNFRLTIVDELNRSVSDSVTVTVNQKAAEPSGGGSGGGGGASFWLNWMMLAFAWNILYRRRTSHCYRK
jgi:K319-like protein